MFVYTPLCEENKGARTEEEAAQKRMSQHVQRAAETGNWLEIENNWTEVLSHIIIVLYEKLCPGEKAALTVAADHGHSDFVLQLIKLGALVDKERVVEGYHEAVIKAAKNCDTEFLQVLAKARLFDEGDCDLGINLNLIDETQKGDFSRVEMLLKSEAKEEFVRLLDNGLLGVLVTHRCPPSCLLAVLDLGVDFNRHDNNGYTPLMWAVLSGSLECIHFLICDMKVEINSRTKRDDWGLFRGTREGRTALMHAAGLRKTECLSAMLEHVTMQDLNYDSSCALSYAARVGNTASVSLLIKAGAEIEISSDPGTSIVDQASESENIECFEMVLKSLSHKHILSCLKNSYYKSYVRNVVVLGTLLKYITRTGDLVPFCYYDYNGDTLLASATKYGCLDSVRLLLKYKEISKLPMDILTFPLRDDMNNSLIHSCIEGHLKITELLINHGANHDAKDKNLKTAFMYACEKGHNEIVDLILKHGANIDAADQNGQTALMHSCLNGNNIISESLTKHGANINARDIDGINALMYACINGHDNIAVLLMAESRTCANDRDVKRKTALMYSCEFGQYAVVDVLIKRRINSIRVGDRDNKETLETRRQDKTLSHWSPRDDLDASDEHGQTAMMFACKNVIDCTKKNRKHVCRTDDESACSCYEKCFQMLLSSGANTDHVTTEDGSMDTVLSIAMRGNTGCLRILLDSGKLMNMGMLKPQHKDAVRKATERNLISLHALLLVLKYGVFQWEWCRVNHFPELAIAALRSGICPGKIKYGDIEIYPLTLAFIRKDVSAVKVFIESHYFFEEDYMFLRIEKFGSRESREVEEDETEDLRILMEQLTLQPLSLKTWSFLSISKAISLSGIPTLRAQRVDCLPIPQNMKMMLKFENN